MRRLPSAFFSGAGDTLRVSPDPLPAMEAVIQTRFCTSLLHNSYTAKMWLRRSGRMSNF
jgi:hypothetical protein